MRYVYTRLGEEKAKEYGFTDRKEGQTAMWGSKPIDEWMIACGLRWDKLGYIRKEE